MKDCPAEEKAKPRNLYEPTRERVERIFQALPPLHSLEYLEILKTASAEELPAQVLARAYRTLAPTAHKEAADRTLERLLDARNHFGYLRSIQVLAKERVEDGHFEYDENDLINETLWEIAKVLPTKRGQMAEQAWVGFCRSRLEDVRRRIQGRKGNKERWKRAEMKLDKESGRFLDPLEEIHAPPQELDRLLASEAKQDKLRTIIRETIAKIQDPLDWRSQRERFSGRYTESVSGFRAQAGLESSSGPDRHASARRPDGDHRR